VSHEYWHCHAAEHVTRGHEVRRVELLVTPTVLWPESRSASGSAVPVAQTLDVCQISAAALLFLPARKLSFGSKSRCLCRFPMQPFCALSHTSVRW
jgi:hypothetical protein